MVCHKLDWELVRMEVTPTGETVTSNVMGPTVLVQSASLYMYIYPQVQFMMSFHCQNAINRISIAIHTLYMYMYSTIYVHVLTIHCTTRPTLVINDEE